MPDRDEELITRLRRVYEAFNRGDFDTAIELADPGIEFIRPAGQYPLTGADAVRQWMQPDAFEEQAFEPLDFRVQGNKVLVHHRGRARGAGSGIEVSNEVWVVWTLNDEDLVTRVEVYQLDQEAEALEAAGISK